MQIMCDVCRSNSSCSCGSPNSSRIDSKQSKRSKTTIPSHITIFKENGVLHYKCTICDKAFKSRDQCRYHRYCHSTSMKPHSCQTCDKKFSTKSHLDYHQLTHTGDLPFKCDQCEKGFRTNQKLKRHIASHSGVKSVSCHICDKLLSSYDVLKVHLRTHSEVRPFKCDQCNASFKEKATLNKHISSHSGEKNWVCELCGKKYGIKWNLVLHKRIHTTSRPYKCNICDRKFTNHSHLKRHQAIHADYSEEYTCSICDKGFTRKDNLTRHVKNTHFEEEDPESETVSDCIKQSTLKINRKSDNSSSLTSNNNRSSVIKSVASVLEVIQTPVKEDNEMNHEPHKAPVDQIKQDVNSISNGIQARQVSVINRIESSNCDRIEITPKTLLTSSEASQSSESKNDGSTSPGEELSPNNHTSVCNNHSSEVASVIKASNSSKGKSGKQCPKLIPFRILNHPSIALNLSARKVKLGMAKSVINTDGNVFHMKSVTSLETFSSSIQTAQCMSSSIPPEEQNRNVSVEGPEFVDSNTWSAITSYSNTKICDKVENFSRKNVSSVHALSEPETLPYENIQTFRNDEFYSNPIAKNLLLDERSTHGKNLPEFPLYITNSYPALTLPNSSDFNSINFTARTQNNSPSSSERKYSGVITNHENYRPNIEAQNAVDNSEYCESESTNSEQSWNPPNMETYLFNCGKESAINCSSLDLSVRKYLT